MAVSFFGKTIWITGASSGIGESLAYLFAKQKAKLIISARRKDELERVASRCRELGGECNIFPFDLSVSIQNEAAADEILKKFKYIDVLVINGGISQRSLLAETPVEVDRKIMEIDFFSGVILTKKILPSMIQRKSGHIVVISSIVGLIRFPLRSAYSAAKHALIGFYETLWAELNPGGIDVTIVCPGRIRTNVSINAITNNGKAYGVMDQGQDRGMSADKCAMKIIKAVKHKKVEAHIGGKEYLMFFFKRFFPFIFYKLVTKVKPT
jgi:dehydrogenase/reductase SDR family member 7B